MKRMMRAMRLTRKGYARNKNEMTKPMIFYKEMNRGVK